MNPLLAYTDFIARHTSPHKTPDRPFVLYVLPTSAGAAATERNRAYADAKNWAEAQRLWFRALEDQQTKASAKRHAKFVMSALKRIPELGRASPDLPALCEKNSARHGNSSNQIFTLHSAAGASVTGTRTQLAAATGLAYERVRDLVLERRRFTKGWGLTEEDAKNGSGPPGRPRKPDKAPEPQEFFASTGVEFF